MSMILSAVGLIFITIALTIGRKRRKVYIYSLAVCIGVNLALAEYYILRDSHFLLVFMAVAIVVIAFVALFFSNKITRSKYHENNSIFSNKRRRG